VLGSCAAEETPQRDERDLVIAVQDLKYTLDPLRELAIAAQRIYYNVFDTLLEHDPETWHLQPSLAQGWRRIDSRAIEFQMRAGVRCHDGEELTAEDVAFSFGSERMFNPALPGFGMARALFGGLERVDPIGRYAVRAISRNPDPVLEHRFAVNGSQIVSKKGFRNAHNYDAWSRAPIGSGPYRVERVTRGQAVTLAAHRDFWGGAPRASRVAFTLVPQIAGRIAGLLSGQYDVITDVPPDLLPALRNAPGIGITGGPINNIRILAYDSGDPLLRDPSLRRALNASIDYETIAATLFAGQTHVPPGYQFPSYGPLFIDDAPRNRFDPALAHTELRQSAYRGEVISYRILQDYYVQQVALAETLQQMWKAAGINVRIELKENWAQVQQQPGRQIFDLSSEMKYPDPVGHLVFMWGERGPMQTTWTGWTNAEFNACASVLESGADQATRRAAFGRMLEIMVDEDPPGTALHLLPLLYAVRSSVGWKAQATSALNLRPSHFARHS
jgi:peptide/nickel transport system substrate-binding protein